MLGGTGEANRLADLFASSGISAVYSYAGRTSQPRAMPLPTRIGGFGGVDGLIAELQHGGFTHVVDATHPFAAGMSRNAALACHSIGLPLITLSRPQWDAVEGDRWISVPDMDAAAASLPSDAASVFLAIGRQQAGSFRNAPQHRYLLRVADATGLGDEPESLISNGLPPDCTVIEARGPFAVADELALLRQHGIGWMVSKNAGGAATAAKLTAARQLGIPVIMVERPAISRPDGLRHHFAHDPGQIPALLQQIG